MFCILLHKDKRISFVVNKIMFQEALAAGLWASVGSTLGKLSGSSDVVGESYIIWLCLLLLMVVANTWGCRYYLRSLDAAENSVSPTVISSAVNYICSGIIGMLLFEEASSVRWWLGATLITIGLALVARPEKPHSA